ncbi:hypothetical protein [Phycicoccus avicenniae]|uniref:hypothetical protein n=1 Tax=Phycicoccus avicenniae TaxID=2828860 RepID=UPI003D285B49
MSPIRHRILRPPATVLPVALAMAMLSCTGTGTAAATGTPATGTASAAVVATTFYVSPTGSDAAAGTESAPLRTPQVAVDRLGAAGGAVVLRGGTYRGQRIVLANRTDVTVRAAAGEQPVLDLTGSVVPAGTTGVVEVRNGARVAVEGLTVTGYRTRSTAATPVGIYATGATAGLRVVGNHVHHLGNDNPTLGSFDTNAHGIAVYGRSATSAMRDVTVSGNEVDNLVLGASEAVVLNGNVDGFAVTGNSVHDTNNIGIDAIGFEGTIGGAARWTDVNRARNGRIADNTVTRIRSEGNPAYFEDGQYCNCAGGIYLDGALNVTIEQNTVRQADIGIEVASEWARGRTNGVLVQGNTVTDSRYTGVALGGYDTARGEAYDITVTGNTLRNNNTLRDGSPEVLLQYFVHDTRISGNTVTATDPAYPLLVSRVRPAGTAARNRALVLDGNSYGGPVPASEAVFVWNGTERVGLDAWRRASGQDATSTWTVRP